MLLETVKYKTSNNLRSLLQSCSTYLVLVAARHDVITTIWDWCLRVKQCIGRILSAQDLLVSHGRQRHKPSLVLSALENC